MLFMKTIMIAETMKPVNHTAYVTRSCNWLYDAISWCNANQGFVSAALTVASLLLSGVAIYISVRANRAQSQTALFQHRLKIYLEIDRIYSICECFVKSGAQKGLLARRSLANMLLYRVTSKEFEICSELIDIEKQMQECPAENELEHRRLNGDLMRLADSLVPDFERENQLVQQIKGGYRLLYPERYREAVDQLLEQYLDLYFSHTVSNNEEFELLIERMGAVMNKLKNMDFSEMMEKKTMNKKRG